MCVWHCLSPGAFRDRCLHGALFWLRRQPSSSRLFVNWEGESAAAPHGHAAVEMRSQEADWKGALSLAGALKASVPGYGACRDEEGMSGLDRSTHGAAAWRMGRQREAQIAAQGSLQGRWRALVKV